MLSFVKKALSTMLSIAAAASVAAYTTLPVINSGGVIAVQAEGTSAVANPFIWSDVPDPDIIRVGDTYYMVSTTMFFDPGAPIMKSKDLVSWEICNYVYDTLGAGKREDLSDVQNGEHMYSKGQWAASLRYHKGMFYVFFGSYSTGKSYIFKTNDIENGSWTKVELNGMYHDASLLFDDDGRNYLVYGGGGEIKIKEFNSDMTDFKWGGLDKTIFKTGLTGLSGEGSHIQKINGWYYVFIIAWPDGHPRIELCYRSKDLNGNFEGKTVLESGLGSYGSGVAQGGIVDTPDGKWYALLFQDHGAVGRIPVLVPVTWQNDWPIMGINGKAPVKIDVDGGYAGTFLAKSDEFDYSSDKLMPEWQWNHAPDNTAWSVTERPGWLRLKNKQKASNILNARNTLTMRTEGPACRSEIKLDTKGMKPGDYAGLSAFQLRYGNVGVYVTDSGEKKIYMAENGNEKDIQSSYNKIVEETGLIGDEIYLRADFKFNNVNADKSASNNIDKASFYYSYNGSDWTRIGKEISMSYDLKLFTGYRSGIYSYTTKDSGGYADIDFLHYQRDEWNAPTVIVPIEPNQFGWYFSDGFDNGADEWSGRGDAKVSAVTDEHFVGSGSIFVTDRQAAWNGASKKLDPGMFSSGTKYSFSTNVKYNEGEITDTFYLKLQYKGSDGKTYYDSIAEGTAIKGEWMQLANMEYMIPKGASDMYIYVETAEGTNSFYVDETIGAVEGTGILGAEKIVIEPGDVNYDGVVNCIDLILTKRLASGDYTYPKAEAAADVDSSRKVDITDIDRMFNFLCRRTTDFTEAVERPVFQEEPPIVIDDPIFNSGEVVLD